MALSVRCLRWRRVPSLIGRCLCCPCRCTCCCCCCCWPSHSAKMANNTERYRSHFQQLLFHCPAIVFACSQKVSSFCASTSKNRIGNTLSSIETARKEMDRFFVVAFDPSMPLGSNCWTRHHCWPESVKQSNKTKQNWIKLGPIESGKRVD